MSTHLFGYAASAILFVTLAVQIRKQWQRGTTKGVSRWLFIGQFFASVGFTIHSAIIGSTLFVVVNAILSGSAVIGMTLWFVQHRRELRKGRASAGDGARDDFEPTPAGGLTSEVGA